MKETKLVQDHLDSVAYFNEHRTEQSGDGFIKVLSKWAPYLIVVLSTSSVLFMRHDDLLSTGGLIAAAYAWTQFNKLVDRWFGNDS